MRVDLVERALDLARMLRLLLPDEREVAGLLALLLVHHARAATRVDDAGRLLRLSEQDRLSWDAGAIAEADALVVAALRAGPPGRFTLQAAIAGAARAGADLRGDRLAAAAGALRRAAAASGRHRWSR